MNPCKMSFDPGFVDRTHILFNYADFDPCCLRTPQGQGDVSGSTAGLDDDCSGYASNPSSNSRVSLTVSSPSVDLYFYVPKADMRNPKDIPQAEFVHLFWTRKVHPELFLVTLKDLDLVISKAEKSQRLKIGLTTSHAKIDFQESAEGERMPLLIARKSSGGRSKKPAGQLTVSLNLSEDQKPRGFTESRPGDKFRTRKKSDPDQPNAWYEGADDKGQDGSSNSNHSAFAAALARTDGDAVAKALDHGAFQPHLMIAKQSA